VHINTLLLGAFPPDEDSEFLYSSPEIFRGEAVFLAAALDIPHTGKTAEAVTTEFQRRGFFLAHFLECPVSAPTLGAIEVQTLLERRLPAEFTRIRRSLKPKRVVLAGEALEPFSGRFVGGDLGCPVVLNEGRPFRLKGTESPAGVERLRTALDIAAASAP
jgi:hypothetical protein